MFCGGCGNQIKEGAMFCPNCGWKVPQKEAASASEANVQTNTESVPDKPDTAHKCRNCGKPVQDDWIACPFCGTDIIRKIICENCKHDLEAEWKVCPFCKTPVGGK